MHVCIRVQTHIGRFLTSLGGGAFGNKNEWIEKAIAGALSKHRGAPLDVKLVHYGFVPLRSSIRPIQDEATDTAVDAATASKCSAICTLL